MERGLRQPNSPAAIIPSRVELATLRSRRRDHAAGSYVCPDCKTQLVDLRCLQCARQYKLSHGFPVLLSSHSRYQSASAIVEAYESIYERHSDAWENQGKWREFIAYLADLLNRLQARRVLDVGCGEGALLAALSAGERYGTDLSIRALERAHACTAAGLCVALGERLPYSDGFFDVVASVRVMEHLLDAQAGCAEIFRVLREGGRAIVAINLQLTGSHTLWQKISDHIDPQPRALVLATWLLRLIHRPIREPIEHRYTMDGAKVLLERSGFEIVEVIHKGNAPGAPFPGPQVVVFLCHKPATKGT